MDKSINKMLFVISIVAILLTIMPAGTYASGVAGVTRSVTGAGSGEYEVTLHINASLPAVVGIRENLPDGCTFVNSTLPGGQYRVNGNEVSFAAINTTEFKYTTKGTSPANVVGQWTDMLSNNAGTIGVSGSSAPAGSAVTGTDTGKSASSPGFEALLALVAVGAVAYLVKKD